MPFSQPLVSLPECKLLKTILYIILPYSQPDAYTEKAAFESLTVRDYRRRVCGNVYFGFESVENNNGFRSYFQRMLLISAIVLGVSRKINMLLP